MDALLRGCTNPEVQPFSEFLRSQCLLSLIPFSANYESGPVIRKIGEASYSEVFGLSAYEAGPEIVVKVVPLLEQALLQRDTMHEVDLPDCTLPENVLREIEVTRMMAGIPDGGFINFLGYICVTLMKYSKTY